MGYVIKQETANKSNSLTNNYKVSDNITKWVDKFGICEDVLAEAKSRQNQLVKDLSNIDKRISDVLHKVEIENSKDLYHGWLLYKEIKSNREKRREIKDELEVINNVLRPNKLSVLSRDKIKQNINRLENRTYTYRIVK